MSDFQEKVYKIVSKIPRGKVLTYAEVARKAGSPRAMRAVGNIMKKNPHPKEDVPCHRVIRSDGFVGGYGRGSVEDKAKLLRGEGVLVADDGMVSFKR